MEVAERRAAVVRLLRERGQVSVAELSRQLAVSEMTARRDLEFLEHEGLARRYHGGAVTTVSRSFEVPFAARAYEHQPQKRAIGLRTAELIMPGETVIIDAGTTAVEVARALRDRANLLICPLSLQAAGVLADRPGIRLLVPGGEVRPGEQMFVGEVTRGVIAGLRFDTYVMAVGGLSRVDGFTDFSLDDVAVKQAALRSARRTVVACDSSKVGKVGFAMIGGLAAAGTLVTDDGAADADRAWLTEAGLDVVIA
ncbi:MAG TPA: DeoR/GlpR family DNA-binding transcription regulator [Streptosporangiaceae bacterium]|nr:DeoR/GlpR family DNA-binding transcription regulator [Streptosporangiaceae bacterium]